MAKQKHNPAKRDEGDGTKKAPVRKLQNQKKAPPPDQQNLDNIAPGHRRRIMEIISKHSQFSVAELTSETRLDEINIQSLDLFEIIFDIEERFKIDIPDPTKAESRLQFTTIGQIADGERSVLAKSLAA